MLTLSSSCNRGVELASESEGEGPTMCSSFASRPWKGSGALLVYEPREKRQYARSSSLAREQRPTLLRPEESSVLALRFLLGPTPFSCSTDMLVLVLPSCITGEVPPGTVAEGCRELKGMTTAGATRR